MEITEKAKEQISQLQLVEQKLQGILLQKQTFQTQLLEVENALNELKKAKGDTFKIIGNIMVASKKEALNKDLKSKKEILDLCLMLLFLMQP
jgi:prefoldin beta subunit